MHVTLINPGVASGARLMRSYSGGYGDLVEETDTDQIVFPPLELLRMATVLRAQGFEIALLDLQVKPDQALPDRSDVVVSTLSMPTLDEDCASAAAFKSRLGATRLLVLTSIADQAVLDEIQARSGADTVFGPRQIEQAASLCSGTEMPAPAAYIAPDRSLIDNTCYSFSPMTDMDPGLGLVTAANASYGCPYPCGYYCPYPAAEGTKFRPVPLETLLDELKSIAALGIGGVVFRDPTFSLDMARTAELCDRMVAEGIRLAWWCETRLDRLDQELLTKMAEAGCRGIEIGVESGDPQSQAANTRKKLDLQRLVDIRAFANALGIKMQFLFIVGLPGDTRQNIINTYRFIIDCGLGTSEFNLSTITPYPGTPFYQDALDRGWFEFKPSRMTGYQANSRTDTLSLDEIATAVDLGETLRARLDAQVDAAEIGALLERMEAWAKDAPASRMPAVRVEA
ncbi:radical SAM protein [Mitsuaria sp. WAJ17]|uniref:radical SAM protein n=1 Tax=Mitsuaria sp. WAJ17 TaxID=2761452 RepID=UPI001603F2DE|nr:radical SAM protein [Mitsuaria sp. WAJ17]MBB2485169.1 radical SAM protein [Mitsuaria sp. WAJ17]